MRDLAASRALLMRAEDLTKTLDHMVLAPDHRGRDHRGACAEARDHHFAALCSYPSTFP